MTNIYGGITKGMRFCFGIYSTKEKAIETAKENDFYTCGSEVEVIECEIDNFEEI
jgi:hypothetical protein